MIPMALIAPADIRRYGCSLVAQPEQDGSFVSSRRVRTVDDRVVFVDYEPMSDKPFRRESAQREEESFQVKPLEGPPPAVWIVLVVRNV